MNKRDFLRIAPLAAMSAVTLKVGDVSARAYEVNANKQYLIVLPEFDQVTLKELQQFKDVLHGRGIDATVVAHADGLQIYELDKRLPVVEGTESRTAQVERALAEIERIQSVMPRRILKA